MQLLQLAQVVLVRQLLVRIRGVRPALRASLLLHVPLPVQSPPRRPRDCVGLGLADRARSRRAGSRQPPACFWRCAGPICELIIQALSAAASNFLRYTRSVDSRKARRSREGGGNERAPFGSRPGSALRPRNTFMACGCCIMTRQDSRSHGVRRSREAPKIGRGQPPDARPRGAVHPRYTP